MALSKFKKVSLIVIAAILALVVTIILCISPIAKYLIEKYDTEILGREITIDWAYVNPFTGAVHLDDLKIFESKSDTVFLSASSVSADFAMHKLLSGTYEISEITLNKPLGKIIQKNNKDLNFNDIIERFKPKDTTHTNKEPLHFNILNIKINQGKFYYIERQIPINYFIKEVNLESSGKRWNSDTINVKFSLISGPESGGSLKGGLTINTSNLDYDLNAVADKFDLDIIEQYLDAIINYGTFEANLDASIRATGNFKDTKNINTKGQIAINDFHFGKSKEEDYASFKKLKVDITELNPKNKKYLFKSVLLDKPYFKYERYDGMDNLATMFGKGGSNIKSAKANTEQFNLIFQIADYIKDLAYNFLDSDYKIDSLAIKDGNVHFNDYSIGEKFSIALAPLNVSSDSIDKKHKRLDLLLDTGIKPYGHASVNLSINPKDYTDFDMRFKMQKLPASLFNPYVISYTSFPINRGTVEMQCDWDVNNGSINSNNHFLLLDPRIASRIKKGDTKHLPMPLILYFVKETGNVIDYKIPITGNLKSPKFHLGDVILDLLENIFIKPVRLPYVLKVNTAENKIENLLTLNWPMRQSVLRPEQEKFVNKIAEFLKKDGDALIHVHPIHYTDKEKEYILLYEAKKKYYLLTRNRKANSFTEEDSVFVNKMSSKDPAFVKYLDKHKGERSMFTVQEKSEYFIGNETINKKFKDLIRQREEAFMAGFKKNGTGHQVKIYKGESSVPYNGFSFFKLSYENELPLALYKAYQEMEELNEENPRKKYEKDREIEEQLEK